MANSYAGARDRPYGSLVNELVSVETKRSKRQTRRRIWQLPAALTLVPLAIAAVSPGAGHGPLLPAAEASSAVVAASGTSGFQDQAWGDDTTREDEKASRKTGDWRAEADLGSLFNAAKNTGAHDVWASGVTGRGVDVAVIDTGISPVQGLDDPTKVVNGPDLSFESQNDQTRHLDGYGHGTHMAGIIAGRDADVVAGQENDPDRFVGIAPDARIVNLKVASADGGADVTQIIAAIDWAVQHRNDAGLNIRVINLSYGTSSTQPYLVDPLAYAVENAWRKGIVVVVAAGNDGAGVPVTMPAANPHVLSVGAVDHLGTKPLEDDVTADFTNSGNADRRPDLLAPGKSVVSLRTPGSYSDRAHPEGLVSGDDDQRFFRGSGTSQATAVVSGAVALMLQQRPDLTPDQVKHLLLSTADPLAEPDPVQGAGVLDIDEAVVAAAPSPAEAAQSWPAAEGTGTLEGSRGESHVVDPTDGAVLDGEIDAMGSPWDARSWRTATAAGAAWSGGEWNGRTWAGSDWSGSSWTARSWRSAAWSGDSWAGGDWLARSWRGDVWSSAGWESLSTASRSWTARSWRARSWRTVLTGPGATW